MNLNLEAAFNNLSFGAVSFGVSLELFKRDIYPNILPIANNLDINSQDKAPQDYKNWLTLCAQKFYRNFNKNYPTLKVWHIQNSWHKVSDKQYLLTFSELDRLTDVEVNILNQQEKIFVTSNFTKSVFEKCGVEVPVIYTPLGFDSIHYYKTDKKYLDDCIVWDVHGKFEPLRKRHEKTIKTWIKVYGGNRKHRLHLYVTNPFVKPEQMQQFYNQLFEGKQPPFNITVFNYLATNSLLNDGYNCCNIVLAMGNESIDLPGLTCCALGKHAVVHNTRGIKDWANDKNAVLVNSKGQLEAHDGMFFFKGQPYNQGFFDDFDENDLVAAMETAVKRYESNPINEEGLKLQETYSFKRGVDIILKEIQS